MSEIANIPVIDVDSHITEPPDLWTSRMSAAKWGDAVPQTQFDESTNGFRWVVAGRKLSGVVSSALATGSDMNPATSLTDIDPAAWEPNARLERLDEFGIYAEVLYPNLMAFHNQTFMQIKNPELLLQCVRTYNDFLVDFASADPKRLLPVMALPFWNLDESIKEIHRNVARGHRGIMFSNSFAAVGLPELRDPHWHPIFETAQDLELSINFHIGFAERNADEFDAFINQPTRADYAKISSLAFLSNARSIVELIVSGMCHRFPRLNFVAVESGYAWLPFMLEALEWEWKNSGAHRENPDWLLPTEFFRRQIFGSFWFEHESFRRMIDLYPDNLMFESDFPHGTSVTPRPGSYAENPKIMLAKKFDGLPLEYVWKALWQNAARLYHVDEPALVG